MDIKCFKKTDAMLFLKTKIKISKAENKYEPRAPTGFFFFSFNFMLKFHLEMFKVLENPTGG